MLVVWGDRYLNTLVQCPTKCLDYPRQGLCQCFAGYFQHCLPGNQVLSEQVALDQQLLH